MSADPALASYLPGSGQGAGDLPGEGGVFAPVNLNVYHYGANNPLFYHDPTGLDDVSLHYDKSAEKLETEFYDWDDEGSTGLLGVYRQTYDATNRVKEQENPIKHGLFGFNWYPQEAPEGTWDISGEGVSDKEDVGPFISDISYDVTTYQYNDAGAWQPNGTATLSDAFAHGSDHSNTNRGANSYTDGTFGCIRMRNQDINSIRRYVRRASNTGGDAKITVGRNYSFSLPSVWRRGYGSTYLGRN